MTERIPVADLQGEFELVNGRLRSRVSSTRAGAPTWQTEARPAPAPARADGTAPSLWPLPAWPQRRPLRPEEKLQREILAALLPELAPRGILLAFIGSEIAVGGGIGRLLQATRKAMGSVPGLPDLLVIYPGGRCLLMEVKRPTMARMQPVETTEGRAELRVRQVGRGELSTEQRRVRDWAKAMAVPWAVVRSVDQARAAVARVWP